MYKSTQCPTHNLHHERHQDNSLDSRLATSFCFTLTHFVILTVALAMLKYFQLISLDVRGRMATMVTGRKE